MRKIVSILLLVCLCFSFSACEKKEQVLDIDNIVYSQENAAYYSGEQIAYYKAFYKIINKSPEYLNDIKYFVVDMTNIQLTEKRYLLNLFETFAEEKDLAFFTDKKENLIDRKHIVNGKYNDGLLLTYEDVETESNKIVTKLEIWHSDINKEEHIFTIEKISGSWVVTDMKEV